MTKTRIRNKNLLNKVVTPEIAVSAIKDGMIIGVSGAPHSSGPRRVFRALAERGRRGELKDLSLWSGCLLSKEIDGLAAESGILKRRLGSIGDNIIRKQINAGLIHGNDVKTEDFPHYIRSGISGKVDVAIIEAVAITEEGHIVPSTSLLEAANQVEMADIVIVEVNSSLSIRLEGLHDIYLAKQPPFQEVIPLQDVGDRVGVPYIPAGEEKITFIVESNQPENYPQAQPLTLESQSMAEHLLAFFDQEKKVGKLPKGSLTLSSGIGNASDAVLKALCSSDFKDIKIYSPIMGDSVIELIDSAKCSVASGPVLWLSEQGWNKFQANIDQYQDKVIIRSSDVVYDPGIIKRLGCTALLNALEVDIYGHVNSSHVGGTRFMNGVGGGNAFASNAYLSVFLTLSTGKNGDISSIVPMVPHVDHSEHNVDVIVTEQGLADLRGLSPVERAEKIILKCAHPDYRSQLLDYLNRSIRQVGGHEPHILEEAFSFHLRLKETGSMK